MAAAYGHTKAGVLRSVLRTPGMRREEREIEQLAEERLAFFGDRLVGYRWRQPAYSLSYANRRRLEIARATAAQPRLLLLDEPAAGMNPVETHEMTELIAPPARGGRVHDPRHRARHARRRGDLGPRRRARPRDQDRRGLVRAGRDRPAGGRGVPGNLGSGAQVSERKRNARAAAPAPGHQHLLRADAHPPGRRPRGRRGRARLPARRERLREVDDAEDDPRDRRRRGRAPSCSAARTSPASRRLAGSSAGWRSFRRTEGSSAR